jgi:hypothetical protein
MTAATSVRRYVPGQDDEVRVGIYNRARAAGPEFVPARVEELRRGQQAPGSALDEQFLAEQGGFRLVRCCTGHERPVVA